MLLEEHASFAAAVEAGRPAYARLVPTQLHRMLDDAGRRRARCGTLRTVLLGGGPIDPALRARAADAGVTVVATYGSAETAGGCVYDGVALDGVGLADRDRTGGCGSRGPTLFDGYDGDPALTARVLVDGWFRTEDAARIDEDGRLQVLGRLDDIVVTGGVNVPGAGGRRAGCASTRRSARPRCSASRTRSGGSRLVAFVVGELGAGRGPGLGRRAAPALVGAAAAGRGRRAAAAAQRQGGPGRPLRRPAVGWRRVTETRVFAIALRTRFRGITVREGMLLRGDGRAGASGARSWSTSPRSPSRGCGAPRRPRPATGRSRCATRCR